MVLKDSVRVGEKEIHESTVHVTQNPGEQEQKRAKLDKTVFPGGKQLKHVIAGGVAGAVSRTCVSPLERVKILLQVSLLSCMRLVIVIAEIIPSHYIDLY